MPKSAKSDSTIRTLVRPKSDTARIAATTCVNTQVAGMAADQLARLLGEASVAMDGNPTEAVHHDLGGIRLLTTHIRGHRVRIAFWLGKAQGVPVMLMMGHDYFEFLLTQDNRRQVCQQILAHALSAVVDVEPIGEAR